MEIANLLSRYGLDVYRKARSSLIRLRFFLNLNWHYRMLFEEAERPLGAGFLGCAWVMIWGESQLQC